MILRKDLTFEKIDCEESFAVECPMCNSSSVVHPITDTAYYMRCFECGNAYRLEEEE